MKEDPYYKKRIEYKLLKKKYFFDTAHEIFSTFKVDIGSDLLLDTMLRRDPVKVEVKSVLDIGCGYGTLGIVIASHFEAAEVTMVDKDLLAVRYARRNAELNDVADQVTALGSVGVDEVEAKTFDLIVSNIPAKVGDAAIEHEFIRRPISLLTPHGELWFVVVNALNRLIPRIARKNKLAIQALSKRAGHTVYRFVG